jgi:hypothetical protein
MVFFKDGTHFKYSEFVHGSREGQVFFRKQTSPFVTSPVYLLIQLENKCMLGEVMD